MPIVQLIKRAAVEASASANVRLSRINELCVFAL
jgi:hypothetical protein